jgi:manganese transport protein
MSEQSDAPDATRPRWYTRIGPGLITACVVIGPGSILTSSSVGAAHGFSLLWVVLLSVLVMLTYITLGAKLGVVSQRPTGDLITERTGRWIVARFPPPERTHPISEELVIERAGRWLAILVGAGAFFISAAYQFGNNLGVHYAIQVFVEDLDWTFQFAGRTYDPFDYVVVLFNALAIAFLFGFRNLYKALERLMMTFVAILLLSFAINLFLAQPDVGELFSGFVPTYSKDTWDLNLLGLIGTTFVITAAYYQSYLVQQKGWRRSDLSSGLIDSRVGATIMALITIMLMSTAAAVLRGQELQSVKDVAQSLEPLLGVKGQAVFCLGLFSAAYSSFLVNTMIGGFILADGLGLSSNPRSLAPRMLTAVGLLTGMFVALFVIKRGDNPVGLIVAAQAAVVLVAPLMAGVLWWLTNDREIMGEDRNGPVLNTLAGLGFLLLLGIAARLAVENVYPAIAKALTGNG